MKPDTEITVEYLDGELETFVVHDLPWVFRDFLCFTLAIAPKRIQYLPLAHVRSWSTDQPSPVGVR